MSFVKTAKDFLLKSLHPSDFVPEGVLDMIRYSRDYGGINFTFETSEGVTVARSTDFRYGSIITSGHNQAELDKNVQDAILTAFEVPSVYASKVSIHRIGEHSTKYVAA